MLFLLLYDVFEWNVFLGVSDVNMEKLGAEWEFGLDWSPHWLLLKGSTRSVELPEDARIIRSCCSVCAFCSSTAEIEAKKNWLTDVRCIYSYKTTTKIDQISDKKSIWTFLIKKSIYMYNGIFKVNLAKQKILVIRVTWPYLNLLVKPRIFFRFSGKKIILCILKGDMPLKMHKKTPEKNVCLPYLKFSDPLPETHLYFYFAFLIKRA